jgi:hypothetical protein
MTQTAADSNTDLGALDNENDKHSSDGSDPEQVTRMHSKKSTQTLHERISMLGKLQPARPRKSIPSASVAASAGQVPYPELPASKSEVKPETSNQKTEAPAPEPRSNDDEWIKPLSSPQRLELSKSKTMDIMEKLSDLDKDRAVNKKEQLTTEPERPKSSTSLFSSPRPVGHQQSASLSHIAADISTTPTGSPRRYDGPISASKLRLQSIMKSAKGLFSSTGNTPRIESSSPEQHRVKRGADIADGNDRFASQPKTASPSRQEGRRTRSSTEKEEKRRQHEREEREEREEQEREREREEQQQEEARLEKAREQEKLKALRIKAAQDKSSMEPEEKPAPKAPQLQRQQSREPESSQESSSRFGIPQPKQNDRRPLKPTREAVQKPKPPQPMSIRVGSTLSRQIPMASSSVRDSTVSIAAPASAAKPTLKKKGSNNSLHTASSTSSFKSTGSSQTQAQRKAQLASERRKEQEDRRKEEQKREMDRKRDDARRQDMRSRAESRAETERERREPSAQEDPEKAARMQAIRNRQMENARKHERHGSQQMKEVSIIV